MTPEELNLQEATNALKIETVYLKQSGIFTDDNFSPSTDDVTSLARETFQGTSQVIVNEFKNGTTLWSYRFFYSAGVRLVRENDTDEEQSSEPEILVEIKAVYEALYFSDIGLSEDAVKEFSRANVGFNVWPFWREFVQSSCNRMGLSPSIPVPLYRKSRDSFDINESE